MTACPRSLLPLALVTLLACGDKDDGGSTGGGSTGDDTDTDDGGSTGDEDDTGTVSGTGRVTGTVILEGHFNVAGARVWPASDEGKAVTTNVWGEFSLDLDESESELCVGLFTKGGDSSCQKAWDPYESDDADIFIFESMRIVSPDDFPGLVIGRVADLEGANLVHRGVITQDVTVSALDADGTVLGEGIANIGGWFAFQGEGTVKAAIDGTEMTAEASTSSDGIVAVKFDNTSPVFTGPPIVFNGTAYFRKGEKLEVKTEDVVSDADDDTVTTEVIWSADNLGYVVASDGRGGFAVATLPLQDSELVTFTGSTEAGTTVQLCDGTEVEADEAGDWEATIKTSEARCAVVFRNGLRRWTHVAYAHSNSLRVDADLPAWDGSVTFDAGAGTELVSTGKDLEIVIPAGGIIDSTGARIKGDVTLSYAVIDVGDGMPGEPVIQDKGGARHADLLKGVMLSLTDAKGNEVEIKSDDASIAVLLDTDDSKGRDRANVLSLDEADGSWTDLGEENPVKDGYLITPASGLANALLAVADPYEDFGCVRLYLSQRMQKRTFSVQMVVNKALINVPLSGPVTILGPTQRSKSVELWLLDAFGNIIETVTVPVGLTSAGGWPLTVADTACTDVTLPSAQPAGSFLTRKLVEDANLPSGFDGGDVADAYYDAIDPLGNATTFEDWVNSFSWPDKVDSGGAFDPRRDGGDDAFAIYGNDGDLGFGREMHMRVWEDWDPSQTGEDPIIAMYTTNYQSVIDATTATGVVATVAMEYSPHPVNGGAHYTKFYAFDAAGARIGVLPLDDFGLKAMPDLCTNCHGGQPADESQLTVSGTSLVYPDDGRMNDGYGREPRFIPFAVESFGYHGAYSRAAQEAEFQVLNEALFDTNISLDTQDMITGWYAAATGVQDTSYVPTGWATHPTNSNVDSVAFYQDVVQPYCRSCHLSFNDGTNFADTVELMGMGNYLDYLVCDDPTQMPQAQVTQGNFYEDIDAKLTFISEMSEAGAPSWTATECPH